jgi:hypothetical protein
MFSPNFSDEMNQKLSVIRHSIKALQERYAELAEQIQEINAEAVFPAVPGAEDTAFAFNFSGKGALEALSLKIIEFQTREAKIIEALTELNPIVSPPTL